MILDMVLMILDMVLMSILHNSLKGFLEYFKVFVIIRNFEIVLLA